MENPIDPRILSLMEQTGSIRMIYRKNAAGETEDYLKRHYLVNSVEQSTVIHQFWASDLDGLHDHPWDNTTVVLAGGYLEHTREGTFHRKQGDVVIRKATDVHRIELLPDAEPGSAWTLFSYGKRIRDWGFETLKNGWLRADKYGEMIGLPIGRYGENYRIEGTLFPRFIDERDYS